jgi:hypothetical protein
MKRPIASFAITALLPAMLAVTPASASVLLVPLCTGNGPARMVELPLPGKSGRDHESPCCVKGCHSGASRKKVQRQFDAPQ